MEVASLCQRNVVTIRPSDDLTTAAERMRARHVGYLVVADACPRDGALEPLGVLTDRDIVISVVARHADPCALRVGDVMTRQPVMVRDTDTIDTALEAMRRIGVRRLPVVDAHGHLAGVLALDDIVDSLTGRLAGIAAAIRNEQRIEVNMKP